MSELLSDKVLLVLAIDLGLVVLTTWFVIIFFIIREFHRFTNQFHNQSGMDDKTFALCQESVDNALNYTSENAETIEQLLTIQHALEAQINKLQQSALSVENSGDQETIDHLNSQLEESDRLIRKLKSDLDKSVKGLKVTRQKLYSQYDTVDSLKVEKQELQKQFEQLEQEYIRMSQSAEANTTATGSANNNVPQGSTASQEALENNKRQLQELRNEMSSLQGKLHHAEKEKQFIEERYLEMLKDQEEK